MAEKKKEKPIKRAINSVAGMNIGLLIFLIFVIYIAISIFRYANKTHLSIYEVPEGIVATDNRAVGIILRDETQITSDRAGYVNYYLKNGTRVSKGKTVFSIDDNKKIYDALENSDLTYSLSDKDISDLKKSISAFHNDYNDSDYSEIYSLSETLSGKVRNIADSFLLDNLSSILENTGISSSLQVVKTPSAGVVSYYTDKYENLTQNDISTDLFKDYSSYKVENLYDKDLKESGSMIYKLLTSEKWTLIINLSAEQYSALHHVDEENPADTSSDEEHIKLNFMINRDKLYLSMPAILYPKDGGYYVKVEMDKYMIRYFDERFLEVTLNLDSQSGLKIPNTSILTKDFYMIPVEMLTRGGDSDAEGVIVKSADPTTGDYKYEFTEVEIYYRTDTHVYVDMSAIKYGNRIVNMDTEEDFQVSMVGKLEGVYSVNKGYAQFRRIERLYNGEAYTIVKEGMPLSISEHDHIALDASKIDEAAVIY